MAEILIPAVIEAVRHLCETQQHDEVWLQNYLLAACDTIAALRAENDELRRRCEAVERIPPFGALERLSDGEWLYCPEGAMAGGEPGNTPWEALGVKEAK